MTTHHTDPYKSYYLKTQSPVYTDMHTHTPKILIHTKAHRSSHTDSHRQTHTHPSPGSCPAQRGRMNYIPSVGREVGSVLPGSMGSLGQACTLALSRCLCEPAHTHTYTHIHIHTRFGPQSHPPDPHPYRPDKGFHHEVCGKEMRRLAGSSCGHHGYGADPLLLHPAWPT